MAGALDQILEKQVVRPLFAVTTKFKALFDAYVVVSGRSRLSPLLAGRHFGRFRPGFRSDRTLHKSRQPVLKKYSRNGNVGAFDRTPSTYSLGNESLGASGMAETIEVVVLGAGAVGLAIGRALAKTGFEVAVPDIRTETTSRNSEVCCGDLLFDGQPESAAPRLRSPFAVRVLRAERCGLQSARKADRRYRIV
jgi:hypothetical protein